MALSPKDQKHRDNLHTAVHTLRETGHPDLAESVEHVLSPQGHRFVDRLRLDRMDAEPGSGTSLSVRMPEGHRDLLKARAEKAGDSLSEEANEGLLKFASGDFTPAPPIRARRNSFGKAVGLNLKLNALLFEKAEAECEQLRESGTRLYVSNVVYDWLCRRYQVGPYAETESAP